MSAAEFSQKGTIEQRDRIRGRLIGGLLEKPENKVIAVSPLSYRPAFEKYLRRRDVTAIVLIDTPEHIYKRIEFVDSHDTVYMDAAYKKSQSSFPAIILPTVVFPTHVTPNNNTFISFPP